MAIEYGVLGQVSTSTLGATTEGDLYTAAYQTVISTIAVANLAGTAATFRIAVRPSGEATTTDKNWIVYGATVGASDSSFLTVGLTLGVGDKIRVFGSSATLSFSVYGSKMVP